MPTDKFFRCTFCPYFDTVFPDGVAVCAKCRKDVTLTKKVKQLAMHYSNKQTTLEAQPINMNELWNAMRDTCKKYHDKCQRNKYRTTCCICRDTRGYSYNNLYADYVDKDGNVLYATRYENYCTSCKKNCENEIKIIEDYVEADFESEKYEDVVCVKK